MLELHHPWKSHSPGLQFFPSESVCVPRCCWGNFGVLILNVFISHSTTSIGTSHVFLQRPGSAQMPAGSQKERRENCPAAIGKNVAISMHCISSEALPFCQGHVETFLKTLSGSSLYSFLSYHTTLKPTQTGATVPLIASVCLYGSLQCFHSS